MRVMTVTSRSARALRPSRSFDAASTMSFAAPSLSWGVALTPVVKVQLLSAALNG